MPADLAQVPGVVIYVSAAVAVSLTTLLAALIYKHIKKNGAPS